MIIPIQQKNEGVLEKSEELKNRLIEKGFRVKLDDTDNRPGWKFSECEMRGIPFRIEIGPKDIENNKCVFVRRDTREKIEVSLDEVETKAAELLDTIQSDMYEAAKAHLEAHTYTATQWEEFCDIINNKPGFVKAMWCGDQTCEDKIKEELAATSRCMPFEQEQLSDKCICCGKPAKKMVYWGRAY
jgi:prolyl-tRNA synthetase